MEDYNLALVLMSIHSVIRLIQVSENWFGRLLISYSSTGTIATYFGNLAPPCGCLHAVVHELCVRAYGTISVTKIKSVYRKEIIL